MVTRTFLDYTARYEKTTSMHASDYNAVTKQIVAYIVANFPELSIVSTVSDTASKYSVNLKWAAFDGYINVYCTGGAFIYWDWYFSNGSMFRSWGYDVLATYSYTLNGDTVYYIPWRVTICRLGTFANTITIRDTMSMDIIWMFFNWGYSTLLEKKVYTFNGGIGGGEPYDTSVSNTGIRFSGTFIVEGETISYGELFRDTPDSTQMAMPSVGTLSPSYYPDSSYNYVLVPMHTSTYFGTAGAYRNTGLILWGGLYIMYCLFHKNSGSVLTIANKQYLINGEVYMACGPGLYIPEPSPYA